MIKGKNKSELFLLYVLVTVGFVFSNIIVSNTFSYLGFDIYYSVFTYPLIFVITNIITKNHGAVEAIKAVLLALAVQAFIFILMSILGTTDINLILGTFCSFSLAQAFNIFLYEKIRAKKDYNIFHICYSYVFVILVDSLIFSAIYQNLSTDKNLWIVWILAFIFKAVVVTIGFAATEIPSAMETEEIQPKANTKKKTVKKVSKK